MGIFILIKKIMSSIKLNSYQLSVIKKNKNEKLKTKNQFNIQQEI